MAFEAGQKEIQGERLYFPLTSNLLFDYYQVRRPVTRRSGILNKSISILGFHQHLGHCISVCLVSRLWAGLNDCFLGFFFLEIMKRNCMTQQLLA